MVNRQHSLLRATVGSFEFGLPIETVVGTMNCEHVQYSPADSGPLGWVLSPEEIEIWQIHSALGLQPPRITGSPCLELAGAPRRGLIVDHIGSSARAERMVRPGVPVLTCPPTASLMPDLAIVDGRPLPVLDPQAISKAFRTPVTASSPYEPPTEPRPNEPASLAAASAHATPSVSLATDSTTGKALQVTISPGDDEPLSLVLSLSQLDAITSGLTPVALPHCPPFLGGVVAWKESVAYWIDWSSLFEVPPLPSTGEPRRQIVAVTPSRNLMIFEGDADMMMLGPDTVLDLSDSPSLPRSEVILMEGRIGSRRFVFPDLEAVLELQPDSEQFETKIAEQTS